MKYAYQHIYVDAHHKLIYCAIPKVACTSWKRALLVLSGRMMFKDAMSANHLVVHRNLAKDLLKTLYMFPPEHISKILSTYYKVMFVRDPLERLLSAYEDKFTDPDNDYFPHAFGRKINQMYGKNKTEEELETGNGVHFQEFVQYVLDLDRTGDKANEHWDTYVNLCQPCHVKYDFVGNFSTLQTDAAIVLRNINARITFPSKSVDTHSKNKVERMDMSRYETLMQREVNRLLQYFSKDYSLFNFRSPPNVIKFS